MNDEKVKVKENKPEIIDKPRIIIFKENRTFELHLFDRVVIFGPFESSQISDREFKSENFQTQINNFIVREYYE